MVGQSDKNLFILIQNDDYKAFKILFERYNSYLCVYAAQMVKDNETAEGMTQSVWVNFWEKRNTLKIDSSVKQYLYRSVRNQCLNFLQHNKIKTQYAQKVFKESKPESDYEEYYIEPGLAKKINDSINSLPERRREIFRLSREEGLKYKEIAQKLNISVKTVEAQMGHALKSLREKLKDFNQFFILLHFYFK